MGNPIPPGWTEEQLRNATRDEVERIPLEDCLYLNIMLIEDENARQAAVTRFVEAAQANTRADRGGRVVQDGAAPAAPEQRNVDKLVEVIERQKLSDFGFLVFRLDYSDDARWDMWEEELDDAIQESLHTVAGVEYITDRQLNNPIVSDAVLDGNTVQDVFTLCSGFEAEEHMSEGTVPTLCLAADKEAVESLLNRMEGQEPWLWAVDLTVDPAENPVNQTQYSGYFKVAISALFPELYPMLKGAMMLPAEIWPLANPIFLG